MRSGLSVSMIALLVGACGNISANVGDPPFGTPDAVIDLATGEGVALVKGQWRYSDTKIVEIDFRAPGPDLKPSGGPIKTYDFLPHAGASDFDDSSWEVLDPTALDRRRSTGKLCFNWYRIRLTIPEKVGDFETAGSTVAFETVLDDYAEIWVDGKLPQVLGQTGGHLVKSFNAPNRVVLTHNARPGQQIQLASSASTDPFPIVPRTSSGSVRPRWISTGNRASPKGGSSEERLSGWIPRSTPSHLQTRG